MRTTNKTSPLYRTLWLLPLGFLILAVGLGVPPAQAGAFQQSAEDGEALFDDNCIACHNIGTGDKVGPDLKGVTQRRETTWLTAWISAPDEILAANDPIATELFTKYNNIPMPNLKLTGAQVASLIAFFEKVDSGELVYTPPELSLPPGTSAAGKALFLGETRSANGGPACMVCHNVVGIGALGGGTLGPDLTDVFNRYGGQTGLAAFLGSPSTTTMNAVWANQPMSDQERADLVAFFETTTVPVRPAATLWTLAGLSVAGAALMIAAAQVWWRKRLVGVRKPMIARANARK